MIKWTSRGNKRKITEITSKSPRGITILIYKICVFEPARPNHNRPIKDRKKSIEHQQETQGTTNRKHIKFSEYIVIIIAIVSTITGDIIIGRFLSLVAPVLRRGLGFLCRPKTPPIRLAAVQWRVFVSVSYVVQKNNVNLNIFVPRYQNINVLVCRVWMALSKSKQFKCKSK